MVIDLHLHSTASDGTDSPAEVIVAAVAAGADVVALTDHDTAAGWSAAAAQAQRLGVTFVPGAEISCRYRGIGVHMLAYLYDPEDQALLAATTRTRDDRVDRARRMVTLMSEDLNITWADVLAQVGPAASVGRPHLADALVANGVVGSRDEAFATVLSSRSPYYLPHYAPDAAEMIGLILAAGGVPVIAHPRAGRRGRTLATADLVDLAAAGLVGLEVDHRDHEPDDRRVLRNLAVDLDLIVTGSSDYHGTGKQNRPAEHTTAPEALERIIALGTGVPLVRP